MASLHNGRVNGDSALTDNSKAIASRFSDIPPAIDIPVSVGDTEEAVEVNLEDLLDDTNELCQVLENEKAAKNLWITIALAYAKQSQFDHAIDILNKGLASLARSGPKERLSLLGCISWLHLLKSRNAPRIAPESMLVSEAKTKEHHLREATSTINEALRINPAFPPLFLTRGVLALLRASLQSASRVGGASADLERLESLRQALKCFEEASKLSDGRNMMAIMGRARTLYLLGRFAEALHGYQEVLGKMPSLTDPDPRIGIGSCLWQLGYKDRAQMAWDRSLALAPKSKTANSLLGIYYLSESVKYPASDPQFNALYTKAMIEYTRSAFNEDKNYPLSCVTFASYFLLTKRYPTVEPLARKAIEQTDVNAIASDGWYLLARKEHNLGEFSKASDYYNRSDQARGGLEKGYLPAKFGMIQIMVQTNDFDGAKFRLEKVLQQHSSQKLEAMTLLGCLYAEEVFAAQTSPIKEDKSAEAKKAIHFLETVRKSWRDEKVKVKPDESVLLYLARLYEADQSTECMKCLQQVEAMQLDKLPDDDRPENPEEDAVYMSQLREYLPPQLLNNMACFLYGIEAYDLARETFQIALNACVKLTAKQEADKQQREADGIEEDPSAMDDTDALVTTISYNLARTYEALGMTEEAQKVYESLLARHADYTDASARLAYISLRTSPLDEGPKKIQALYQTDYGNTEVRALMGWYHSRSKRRNVNIAEDTEHRHHKHTLQGYDKHDKYALTGMGNIYLTAARDMPRNNDMEKEKRSKMYTKAVEFFDKALQLDPKNAYAAQGIAIALCDDKRDFSSAIQVFSKIKDAVRDSSIYLNLGHVYAELRQYSKSIENYELALKKDSKAENASLLSCLARAWLLKGKNDKDIAGHNTALSYARRALASQPESTYLQFNIAFVQFQIAQLVNTLAETKRSLQDVLDAQAGLEEAIVTFGEVAKVKQPPYPRGALEQRAAMAKNTMRKQLERSERSQKEYEEKNREVLEAAARRREGEKEKREAEIAAAREREEERHRRMKEERRRLVEETERLAEEERLRMAAMEAMDYTDDEETGERIRKKQSGKGKGGKRKKRDDEDGFIENDDGDLFGGGLSERSASRTPLSGDSDAGEGGSGVEKPKKKRRKLERRTQPRPSRKEQQGKYKSAAVVVDSDSDDLREELSAAATPGDEVETPNGNADDAMDEDQDEEIVSKPAPRHRKQLRTIADEDEDEDEDEGDRDSGNIDIANAAMAAMAAAGSGA